MLRFMAPRRAAGNHKWTSAGLGGTASFVTLLIIPAHPSSSSISSTACQSLDQSANFASTKDNGALRGLRAKHATDFRGFTSRGVV